MVALHHPFEPSGEFDARPNRERKVRLDLAYREAVGQHLKTDEMEFIESTILEGFDTTAQPPSLHSGSVVELPSAPPPIHRGLPIRRLGILGLNRS